MIPGSNLLALAQGLIPPARGAQLHKNTGRATNGAGYQVPSYAEPVPLAANVQPIPTRLFQALGLDWGKEYVTVYTSAGVVAVGRDGSGDKVTYDGKTYLCESATDWKAQDGWVAVVAVRVPE